jgi:TIR domain
LSAIVQPAGPQPKKDFFISYNHEDREWAEWIAWQIEEARFTTVLQAWDFQAGGNFVLKMQDELASASRMIAVLSPSYIESVFTAPEWATFFAMDPTGRDQKLVPVRVRPCQPTGLLSQIIYIDLVDLDREVAKNTLLNGVRPGRAKPASSPSYPGCGGPGPYVETVAASPAVPRRPEASFPGPTSAPPKAGSTPFSLEYAVDIPDEMAGAEAAAILLSFTLKGGGNQIILEFEQDAFEIYNESLANVGSERNRFQFDYPRPGKFQEKLKICAKDKIGNNRVSVTCTDGSGKRWGQNTKNVRISKAPSIWETIRFMLALLLRPIRRRPIVSLVAVLVLLAGSAVAWFNLTTPDNLRKVALWLDWSSPPDYFSSPTALSIDENFNDEANWRNFSAKLRPLSPRRLELLIEKGGYAILLKPSFYDFEADFNVRLPPGVPRSQERTVTWAFRVWPQGPASDILQSRGYLFRLSASRKDGDNSTQVRLNGFKCKHLSDRDCPTFSDPVGDLTPIRCADDPTFQITARVKGPAFSLTIDALHDDDSLACPPMERIGASLPFNDDSRWPLPFFYGGIAFLDAQVVRHVRILPLNWEKPSESEPPSKPSPNKP